MHVHGSYLLKKNIYKNVHIDVEKKNQNEMIKI